MKMRNRCTRLAAAVLAAMLLLSLMLPCTALAAEEEPIISIKSAEDLAELSRNCALDTWSQGKTVVLKSDIDLSGSDFVPIPTFGGTFEGNGHTISGLSLSEGVSYQGLFRYIQESGVVQNLHVSGAVTAVGEQTCLGGIAGSNEGTILNCSFRGTVRGENQVGGIAGVNESTGSIYRCTSEGSVTGESGTGGIAGQNGGTITGCVNQGAVNTVHQEREQNLEEGISGLNREEILDTTTDTGGIVGFSNGVLQSCRNEGAVGYPHVGYNVGGIVGRSSGYLEDCSNTGTIQGRKDVGGIVGQMAPNIRLIFTPSTIDELKSELDRLNAMVNNALDHTDSTRSTLSNRLDQLSDSTQSAVDHVSDLSSLMSDWADGNIDTINNAADTLADTLDQLEEITSGVEGILDNIADGADGLEDSLNDLANAMGMGMDGLNALAETMDRFLEGIRQAKDGRTQIRQAIRNLSNALVVKNPEAVDLALELLDSGTKQLSAGLTQCADALDSAALLFLKDDLENSELGTYLAEYLRQLMDGFRTASGAVLPITKGLIAGMAGTGVDWSVVKQSAQDIAAALRGIPGSFGALLSSIQSAREALSHFADLSGTTEDALAGLGNTMGLFEGVFRDMGDVSSDIHGLFQDLSVRDPVEFDKLGDDFHQAEDNLHSAVTSIGDQMDLLWKDFNASADTLSSDIRELSGQFQIISDLLLDAISDTQDSKTQDLWDDVSEERINNTTLGKARGCTNSGSVAGDLNVGGIAGTMSIESDFDPEDDITEVGDKSLHFRYETRAILQNCVNSGPVTAKKDAAGGAVGRMELGYVLNCENYGAIESRGGDYVGGIAGTANSTIRGCWTKCALSGGSYVGGIAGYGYEIYQCTSLVNVKEAEGYVGSVAGGWDRDDGTLRGNRFVENPLAGVDGISYAGQAEPVAYADLIQEEAVPEPFHSFTLTYVAEENIVETAVFSYGEPVSDHKAPAVPEKEGYYGVWEEIGEDFITFDHVLEAVYTPYTTTLTSKAMRNAGHAVFLVEGLFDSQSALQAEPLEQTETVEQWRITLAGTDDGTEHLVRFTPPAEWKNVSLSLLTEDGSTPIQWEKDGSCCVFTVSGGDFTIEAAPQHQFSPILRLVLTVAAVLVAAVLCVLVVRKRNLKKRRPAALHK